MSEEEGGVQHVQRLSVYSADHRESCVQMLSCSHLDKAELDRQRRCHRPEVLDSLCMVGRNWIPENCDAMQLRDGFLEQLQALRAQLGQHYRQPRHVSAGLSEVGNETRAHWISNKSHDNRDGGRRVLDRLGCERGIRNDYIRFGTNQIRSKLRYP